MEIYGVNFRIQSEYKKMRTRNNSVFGDFSGSVLSSLNERKSFISRRSQPLVFYKKVAYKILPKFTCNFTKNEILRQVYFCEFSEIL